MKNDTSLPRFYCESQSPMGGNRDCTVYHARDAAHAKRIHAARPFSRGKHVTLVRPA